MVYSEYSDSLREGSEMVSFIVAFIVGLFWNLLFKRNDW